MSRPVAHVLPATTMANTSDTRWGARLARLAMPSRYALVVVGGALLLLGAQLADDVDSATTLDLRVLLVVGATFGGFACLLAATIRRAHPLHQVNGAGWWRRWLMVVRMLIGVGATLATVWSLLLFSTILYLITTDPLSAVYWNDVISFTYVNAKATLAGRNPYTSDGSFAAALRRYPYAPATPLRGAVFGTRYSYPRGPTIVQIERRYLAAPGSAHGAFDPRTLHSYPALAFLLYVPLIWLGVQNIIVVHVLVYGVLFAWLIWLAPVELRRWATLAAGSAIALPYRSLLYDTEIVCLALLLLAWQYRERRWVSAALLGLALAFKQYCWYFAPFLLLDVWLAQGRCGGWREALRRAGIALAVFLVVNAPFMIASPQPWFASLWLPMSEPLFPMGQGIIALSLGGFLPEWPPVLYAVGELLIFSLAIWVYVRWRAALGESALLLALLPLLFAFRSPANYFAIAPWLALYAANRILCADAALKAHLETHVNHEKRVARRARA
ncbi:MAG: glycosyltransferase 87 family protein [Ktedonobacterales bacterium]